MLERIAPKVSSLVGMKTYIFKTTCMRWLSYGCFNIDVGSLRTNQIIEHNFTFLHAVLSKMYLKNDFTKMHINVDSFKTTETNPIFTQ